MTIIFWNTQQKQLAEVSATLMREHNAEFLITAENSIPTPLMEQALNLGASRLSPRVSELASSSDAKHKCVSSALYHRNMFEFSSCPHGRYRMWEIRAPLKPPVLVIAVHLADSRNNTEQDQQQLIIATIIPAIIRAEQTVGHQNTIVIGDFNIDPYSESMVGAFGFHAVSTRSVAKRGQRTVHSEERGFFYNPMWRDSGMPPLVCLGLSSTTKAKL